MADLDKQNQGVFICPVCKGTVTPGSVYSPYVPEGLEYFAKLVNQESAEKVIQRINEHVYTPLDTPLPKGLVFTGSTEELEFPIYEVILDSGTIQGGDNKRVRYAHSYRHKKACLDMGVGGNPNLLGILKTEKQEINTDFFRENLPPRGYRFLSDPEFDRFRKLYADSGNPLSEWRIDTFVQSVEVK